jgi:hypothetical protein
MNPGDSVTDLPEFSAGKAGGCRLYFGAPGESQDLTVEMQGAPSGRARQRRKPDDARGRDRVRARKRRKSEKTERSESEGAKEVTRRAGRKVVVDKERWHTR